MLVRHACEILMFNDATLTLIGKKKTQINVYINLRVKCKPCKMLPLLWATNRYPSCTQKKASYSTHSACCCERYNAMGCNRHYRQPLSESISASSGQRSASTTTLAPVNWSQ
jgi:hypothetical protein